MRQHYQKITANSYFISGSDAIIGISSSEYVSVILPLAAVAGVGRTLTIKDEWFATRSDADRIAISASSPNKIDHTTTYSITGDSAALTLYSDGVANWFIY